MKMIRAGSLPSKPGPASYFTGTVRFDMPFDADAPARIGGLTVTFEPGARTAWHTHPLGQTVIITAGLGWCQRDGGPREELRQGDIVYFEPGERHWHGATDKTSMTHIAIAETVDGVRVDWAEHVTDADYLGG